MTLKMMMIMTWTAPMGTHFLKLPILIPFLSQKPPKYAISMSKNPKFRTRPYYICNNTSFSGIWPSVCLPTLM